MYTQIATGIARLGKNHKRVGVMAHSKLTSRSNSDARDSTLKFVDRIPPSCGVLSPRLPLQVPSKTAQLLRAFLPQQSAERHEGWVQAGEGKLQDVGAGE